MNIVKGGISGVKNVMELGNTLIDIPANMLVLKAYGTSSQRIIDKNGIQYRVPVGKKLHIIGAGLIAYVTNTTAVLQDGIDTSLPPTGIISRPLICVANAPNDMATEPLDYIVAEQNYLSVLITGIGSIYIFGIEIDV